MNTKFEIFFLKCYLLTKISILYNCNFPLAIARNARDLCESQAVIQYNQNLQAQKKENA